MTKSCMGAWKQRARRGLALSAVLTIAVLAKAPGLMAAPVYLADLPDFYQHQLSGSDALNAFNMPGNFAGYTDPPAPSYSLTQPVDTGGPGVQWERNGGWCYIAAFTDAFYQLDKHNAPGLFDHGGAHTWLERSAYAIGDLAIKTFGLNAVATQTIDQFIAGYVGAGTVTHEVYTWNAGAGRVQLNGVNTAYASMYDLYSAQIAAGHDALMRITNPGGNNPDWWWTAPAGEAPNGGHFHELAGAGFDNATNTVYFADPNNRGSGVANADWGSPYANAAALPVGAAYYDANTMAADGTLGGVGGYSGAVVGRIDVLYVLTPEPSTFVGAGLAVVFGLAFVRRRRLAS